MGTKISEMTVDTTFPDDAYVPVISESLGASNNYKQQLAARINTLTGGTLASGNLGTFASSLIDDNQTVKGSLISLAANLLASAGSTFVGFIQAGTGAVLRTLQDKNRERITPADFGCVGNGVANDTTAFNACLAASSGKRIYIGKGVSIRISGCTLPDDTIIEGQGSIVLTTDRVTLGNRCFINGITIDGDNKIGDTVGINALNKTGFRIFGVHFKQISFSAMTFSGCTDWSVQSCTGTEIGAPGRITVTSDGMFCYIQNCQNFAIQNCPKIERTYGHAAIYIGDDCTDFSVTGNSISDTFFRGIQVSFEGQARGLIADNRIYRMGELNDTGSGITCNGIYVVTDNADPARLLIDSNHIEKVAENGIEVLGAATVTNNVVKVTQYRGLTTTSIEGIFVEAGCVCKNNTTIDTAGAGIRNFTQASVAAIVIANNTIINAGADGIVMQADTASGVYTNCRVNGNEIISYSGSFAVNFNATNGGTIGVTNTCSFNVAPSGASVALATDIRDFYNSWQW